MKYWDGQEAHIGDKVRLGDDSGGIVVCSVDAGQYSDDHPAGAWGYLEKGVMISFPTYGLIHHVEPDEDLVLLARTSAD